MAQIVHAPWANRRLTKNEMRNTLIAKLANKPCWQCGKYLGSMLYFDFGLKVVIPSSRQGSITQGEATLGIRDCYWKFLYKGAQIVDSDSINDENATKKLSSLLDVILCDFTVSEPGFVSLHFSNDVVLSLDVTNRYATEDLIAEIITPDGFIYTITPRGHFYLSDEVSKIRFSQNTDIEGQTTVI